MSITQRKSKRKLTGGLYKKLRKKKKRDFGTDFAAIRIDEKRVRVVDGLARIKKQRILQTDSVNVLDPNGKSKVVKILNVEQNPANPHFVRMGIITKGAIVRTEMGLARITSRPGQHGIVNAVLIKEK